MNKKLKAFALAFLLLTLVTGILLGFTLGLTHPLPWILIVALALVIVLNKKATDSQFVTWKDEYSVGIESIDNDHKNLLKLINQLQTSSLYYTGENFDKDALSELIDYTKFHFAREEKMMEEHGYPDFEAHRQQHRKMTDSVVRKVLEYEADSEKTVEDLLEYLKSWLINHINGTDKKYSSFLREKGVK
ncbi:bacteriohemerythrin [Alkalimarinus alittae]|uniref:Bacteriohemerythrin n=1 Tax=Alkalimarinus alittae TaxID=2961619 RepID=A0ABY6N2F0_9ALTE|nr:bacteriohemerythrin [Alkalimarinus alittae]UZE96293.1 bacteriohemerythrin [Alkalimarinus alittae]